MLKEPKVQCGLKLQCYEWLELQVVTNWKKSRRKPFVSDRSVKRGEMSVGKSRGEKKKNAEKKKRKGPKLVKSVKKEERATTLATGNIGCLAQSSARDPCNQKKSGLTTRSRFGMPNQGRKVRRKGRNIRNGKLWWRSKVWKRRGEVQNLKIRLKMTRGGGE